MTPKRPHGRQPRGGGGRHGGGGRSGGRHGGGGRHGRSGGGRPGGGREHGRWPSAADLANDPSLAAPPRTHVVGVVETSGRFLMVAPIFERGRRLSVQAQKGARTGMLVLVRTAAGSRGGHDRIERVLGDPSIARDVLEGLMLHRGLQRRWPPGVTTAADEACDRVLGAAGEDPGAAVRRDLRDLPTFTIDPVTAKDFDDAISAQALDDGRIRIWVHIADVTAFVRPGSPVDRTAFERGTSVYVPGKVEPMLPEALSNRACSLVPGEDRLTVTVEMDFDGADVVRVAFHRSVIRSDARLDYDEVDRILEGREAASDPWGVPLAQARRVAAALNERRVERGRALVVESSEPEFEFDRAGNVVALHPTVGTEAHRLIEHLMIAANEQVAKLLMDRGVPTLYRVHERPEPSAVLRLLAQLYSLDVPTPALDDRDEALTPQEAADTVAQASKFVAEHVRRSGHGRAGLTSLVLRALQQARYSPQPLGHAGLGLEHYCHFTSPIRRSPDIVCHRALLSAINAGEGQPRAQDLEEAGLWASARERDAMQIERAADDVGRAFLLERQIFEQAASREYDGEIVGLIGAGAFIAFGPEGAPIYEGMLPVRRLTGDWWDLNEEGTILYGAGTGAKMRLGDPVRVRVRGIEAPRGRVDLELVDGA